MPGNLALGKEYSTPDGAELRIVRLRRENTGRVVALARGLTPERKLDNRFWRVADDPDLGPIVVSKVYTVHEGDHSDAE